MFLSFPRFAFVRPISPAGRAGFGLRVLGSTVFSVSTMAREIIRIISDLHYRDDISWLQSPAALDPILEGADRLVINGDAVDSQAGTDGPEKMAELTSYLSRQVPHATFITGNHDPDISSLHELSLVEGRVWLSHGDVLFRDVVPWSRLLPELQKRIATLSAGLSPAELGRIETRLRIHRQVCLKLPCDHDPLNRGPVSRLRRFLKVVFPPPRALALIKMWRETPGLAAALAQTQRPQAKFILIGHTHSQGTFKLPNGRIVINTGSFCPPRGGQLVEISSDHLRVRRIVRRGGSFHCGSTVAEFPLAVEPLSAVVHET